MVNTGGCAMKDKAEQKKDSDDATKKDESVKKTEGKNSVTSNSPAKKRVSSEHEEIHATQDKRQTPSTSGPLGTEEPGSDDGPGGTGW
jgi:hypothetical protein